MNNQNIFDLLTGDPVELNTLSLKSKLIIVLRTEIESNQWTQQDAATKLGLSQPRISNLMRSRLDKFSIDMLLSILFKMGFSTELTFAPQNEQEPLSIKLKRAML